jgi:hypothetical protein
VAGHHLERAMMRREPRKSNLGWRNVHFSGVRMRRTVSAIAVALVTTLTGCIPIGFKAQTQFAQARDAAVERAPQPVAFVAQAPARELQ